MSQCTQEDTAKHECGHSKIGRNLVVCIDGTSNQFGDQNTNVIELYSLILKEVEHNQRTWYNSGIGTYARPSWMSPTYYRQVISHKVDLAIAWDFEKTVQSAYRWLSDNYEQGDCIFLFGFSRGAFQVRVLSGMIDKVGLIHKGNELQIPFAYEIYRDDETDVLTVPVEGSSRGMMSKAQRFKDTFSHKNVKVHFVGAWDTVSSIGLVRGKRMLPRTVDGMKHVCYFRHALALDERRVKFLPEYAYGGETVHDYGVEQPQPSLELIADLTQCLSGSGASTIQSTYKTSKKYPHTKEVWFAGTHSDIGGGNVENPTMDRGRPPLRWMASEAATAGLRIASFDRELSIKEQIEVIESLTWAWKPLEFLPLERLTFDDNKDGTIITRLPHLGQSRKIKYGQKIHNSVLLADTMVKYTPKARPPDGVDAKTFWDSLREGKEAFEEWIEEDMDKFMRHLVKSALAEHQNPLLEDLLLPALTRGRQELYKTAIEALNNPDLVPNPRIKNQLLSSLMGILGRTSSVDQLQLVPLTNVFPALLDLLTSNEHDEQVTAKSFINKFTGASSQVIMHELDWPQPTTYFPDIKWIDWPPDSLTVRNWIAERGKLVQQPFKGHEDVRSSVAFSPDGKLVASGSEDKTIRIWDIDADTPVNILIHAHESSVESVAFSPDGKYLVSGSEDRTIKLWDVATGELVRGPLQGHTGQVTSVAYSPDGTSLASTSFDRTVQIWDVTTGNSAGDLVHTSRVWSAAFSPDSKRIVSGSLDGTLRIWDVKTGKAIGNPYRGNTELFCSIAYSPDGEYVASVSYDKAVRIWEAETGRPVQAPFR